MHTLYGYILCVVQILVPLPFFLGLRSTNKTPPINATPTTQPTIIKIMAVVDSPPKKYHSTFIWVFVDNLKDVLIREKIQSYLIINSFNI